MSSKFNFPLWEAQVGESSFHPFKRFNQLGTWGWDTWRLRASVSPPVIYGFQLIASEVLSRNEIRGSGTLQPSGSSMERPARFSQQQRWAAGGALNSVIHSPPGKPSWVSRRTMGAANFSKFRVQLSRSQPSLRTTQLTKVSEESVDFVSFQILVGQTFHCILSLDIVEEDGNKGLKFLEFYGNLLL